MAASHSNFASVSSMSRGTSGREWSESSTAGKAKDIASFAPVSNFNTGTTNLPQGIIHVFRDTDSAVDLTSSPSPLPDDKISTVTSDGLTTLAVLAVPPSMTPADFLTFVGPAEEGIAHLRIIRDVAPNRSIVLMKFREASFAEDFAQAYSGRSFNPMDPEICHVVRVVAIDIDTESLSAGSWGLAFSQKPPQPVNGGAIYELPTCPVCLERMDAAVTGLVTVPCSHTFHCMCLSKWGDSRCPVCRYSQTLLTSHPSTASTRPPFASPSSNPSFAPPSTCASCSSSTNLWICLICGNVGCGRYGLAHAHAHYQATMHLYALELETQRVWDYGGDGYVHRLIQNKADGKLVELPSASSMTTAGMAEAEVSETSTNTRGLGPSPADTLAAEKIEAIGIEYSYLLMTQLDSQRAYYEEQQASLEAKLVEEADVQKEFQKKCEIMEKERTKADKRAEKMMNVAKQMEKELREERAVSQGMLKNMTILKEKMETAEEEKKALVQKVTELEDQLRDIMFYMEASAKIAEAGEDGAGEAAGGTVSLPPSASSSRKKKVKK
ncbi:hypothetical protein FRC03_010020 [Tulasnella sp. 419]|nr:hypothetical protein FRC03_010020 [Tulasnella sp. 419]